jgi:diguanylate cyclase (GGDEF)-like protein
MRSTRRHIQSKHYDRQLPWLLMLTLALFISSITAAVVVTTQKISDVDTSRIHLAVQGAVKREISDLARNVDDNAIWDDAALAVYRPKLNIKFALNSWAAATRQRTYFDRLILVDDQDRIRIAYDRGIEVTVNPADPMMQAARHLSKRLLSRGPAQSGIIESQRGLMMVAVANVRPTRSELMHLVPSKPYRLIVARPFGSGSAASIGLSLQLSEVRIKPKSESPQSVAVKDIFGKDVAAVTWPSSHSGAEALRDVLGWILAAGFLNLLLAAYLWRRGISMVERLDKAAMLDALSLLPNRRALVQALTAAEEKKVMIALAMLDLDGFKQVNDHYGHDVGDTLIRMCAARMEKVAEKNMLLVRLGGDEFAILVVGDNAAARLETVSQKLLLSLGAPFLIDARSLAIGASIGLVEASLGDMTATEAMRRADTAMYASKRAGKMRFTWFNDTHEQAEEEHRRLARDLRQAIERREFRLVYQPVYSARDHSIIAVEALIRWVHSERGNVQPNVFIPIADQYGLITEIGRQVVEHVAVDSETWGTMQVCLNMSPAQVRAPDYVGQLHDCLVAVGVPPERIALEIGEALFLADRDHAEKVVRGLLDLGISITLDNFGADAGALNVLRQTGFSTIKLDKALVAAAESNAVALAMLQSTIAVAHAQGTMVVAEGVETETQAQLMRIAGCDALQGWLFGEAIEHDEMTRLLNSKGGKKRHNGRRIGALASV